jgi:hypothetical protein
MDAPRPCLVGELAGAVRLGEARPRAVGARDAPVQVHRVDGERERIEHVALEGGGHGAGGGHVEW